ncbi:DUF2855 family protein [Micromonospora sp. NPDC049102]|uniref:DUF2855 family protein n=1 Tax=Micromonospora sp. NPDC049102 TaxID=3364265 RepID=UPI00371034FD
MGTQWTMAVARDEVVRTRLLESSRPVLRAGDALLRVDRIGLTSNNVTYALTGDAYRYWDFFPTEPGWGVVPAWGFATVVASAAPVLSAGDRVYGFLPCASHLLIRPGALDVGTFSDLSPHRAGLPSIYNGYDLVDAGQPSAITDDIQVLYRPLFSTAFLLADQLSTDPDHGDAAVVLSSASSRTAYATAWQLRRSAVEVIGLTAARNRAFVTELGCYDRVLTYDDIGELRAGAATRYVDFAGADTTRARIRQHLGEHLVGQIVVGLTHQQRGDASRDGAEVFFAPSRLAKRTADWGLGGVEARLSGAWREFTAWVASRADVETHSGREQLARVWQRLVSGAVPPTTGQVVLVSQSAVEHRENSAHG